MQALLLSFFVSFLISLLIVRFERWHVAYSGDNRLQGAQKFHSKVVPRVGGLAIFLGILSASALVFLKGQPEGFSLLHMLALVGIVFLVGLLEDLTKSLGILTRLTGMLAAALFACLTMGAIVTQIGWPWFDMLLGIPIVAIVFTVLGLVGVTNSINIIDGYHGLAAVVSILILSALAYVGYTVGDRLIWSFAIITVGGIAGFLIWNYPRGLIFLGDGGAYLLGFGIALTSVLLVARNPQVSAWFPMLLVIYPVIETLFSIYRKWIYRGRSPLLPDGIHLHMLLYKRVVRWAAGAGAANDRRNANTSPYLWLLTSLAVFPAVAFWYLPLMLQFSTGLYVVLYLYLYQSLIRFKTPRWLRHH
ncbi:glycosyl transferase [Chitinibacter bivalviorum]|uniref:Glycosyl transferase n=1 Tax=Chitinibacter bivalviorum TaxID=2739434 RepID=A0A7H9BR07_9NEIS|nr:glycosyltransferase [Chitinibacter bivalviorum]QLG89664.1 glycosyl transferase [Chitinibacter bivalviorum]